MIEKLKLIDFNIMRSKDLMEGNRKLFLNRKDSSNAPVGNSPTYLQFKFRQQASLIKTLQ